MSRENGLAKSQGIEGIFPIRSAIKPKIDGSLDERIWMNTSPLNKKFLTYYPTYGEEIPCETSVWLAYDDENLYFAFMCHDPYPQKIKTSVSKRDDIFADDWIGLSIDTLGTKQMAFCFFVNPSGIQGDSLRSAVGTRDFSPDFIWESAGKLTEKGYQVEISIPFRSISFKSGKFVEMGILFWRRFNHLGVFGSWPGRKPGQQVFETHTAVFYKNLKNPLKLELLPSITHSRNRERSHSRKWGEREVLTEMGLGLKYGLTSSITAELTLYPDFSQVESDTYQVEVNRRYPLFYTEKRHFFMEGSDIYNFFTIPYGYMPNAVHTRRIVDPSLGTKVTGNVGKAAIGFLVVGDEWPGQTWDTTVNPHEGEKALFSLVRGKYSLGRDNYLGLIYSRRDFLGNYNQVVGADVGHWLFANQKIFASFLHSLSKEEDLNNSGSTFSQGSYFGILHTYITKHVEIRTAFEHIGESFRMDTSYIKRTGINDGWLEIKYNFHPNFQKLKWLKQITPNIFYEYLHDINTGMNDKYLYVGFDFRLLREGELKIHYFPSTESWNGESYDLNQIFVNFNIQPYRWIRMKGIFNYGDKIYYEGQPCWKGKGFDWIVSLVFQFNQKLSQQLDYSHSDLARDGEEQFDINLFYSRTTYQVNKYLFLRAVFQYNSYERRLLADILASFTFIPGTVLHLGYGGLYGHWNEQGKRMYYSRGELQNVINSFFFKASYLWRF